LRQKKKKPNKKNEEKLEEKKEEKEEEKTQKKSPTTFESIPRSAYDSNTTSVFDAFANFGRILNDQ